MKDLLARTTDIRDAEEHVTGTLTMSAPGGDEVALHIHITKAQHAHIADFVASHAGESITLHFGLPDLPPD